MNLKRLVAGCVALCSLVFGISVFAAEDVVSVTYVPIEYQGYAVDSLNGVQALYNPYSYNYQCSEYVSRYYREYYKLDIRTSGSGPSIDSDEYWFEKAEEPQTGDIIFSSAAQRGKSYNHWAIVKDYSDGVITIIEQNWRWSGQAAYERKVSFPSQYYNVYQLKSNAYIDDPTVPSAWAAEELARAFDYGLCGQTVSDYRREVTRREFCGLMLGTILKAKPDVTISRPSISFSDTKSFDVAIASRLGLVDGDADSEFRPDDPITRQEAALMLVRAMNIIDGKTEIPGELLKANSLSDEGSIEDWALEAVYKTTELGLLETLDGGFCPGLELTYEEAVVAAVRMLELSGTDGLL